jgi:general secretion pathway protein H
MTRSVSTSGFTLIELLVVLAILGIVLALVPPALDRLLPDLRVRAAARDLAGGLRMARSRAIQRNVEVPLVIDTGTGTWWLDADRPRALPAGVDLVLTTSTVDRIAENVGRIRFFEDGSSTGGSVALGRAGRRVTIGIDWLTGDVDIVEP